MFGLKCCSLRMKCSLLNCFGVVIFTLRTKIQSRGMLRQVYIGQLSGSEAKAGQKE